jgi:hypothetical protein
MSAPRERLRIEQKLLENVPHNESAQRATAANADIECAIKLIRCAQSLRAANNDMANRSVPVMNTIGPAMDRATAQAAECSKQSGNVARETAKLSGQLN